MPVSISHCLYSSPFRLLQVAEAPAAAHFSSKEARQSPFSSTSYQAAGSWALYASWLELANPKTFKPCCSSASSSSTASSLSVLAGAACSATIPRTTLWCPGVACARHTFMHPCNHPSMHPRIRAVLTACITTCKPAQPTNEPGKQPTDQTTNPPTHQPTHQPTNPPINPPTNQPTKQPTKQPPDRPKNACVGLRASLPRSLSNQTTLKSQL